MARARVDKSIQRVEVDGVTFPLGVYPVEEMKPRTGYTIHFEPADGDDGEWEEWPDRYVFDIFVSAIRVESLCRLLFSVLPGRLYPILDILGQDEYREIDPYIAYELVSQERFLDALRRYRAFFFEDGLVGFGAMSEEPFVYVFVDEHKIVTVRVEAGLRERVEALLAAFDLAPVEEIAGADAATHEHRTVLEAPENRPDLLTVEEIVEDLREDWRLVINLDPESNVDDEDQELGITAWRCITRHEPNESGSLAGGSLVTGSLEGGSSEGGSLEGASGEGGSSEGGPEGALEGGSSKEEGASEGKTEEEGAKESEAGMEGEGAAPPGKSAGKGVRGVKGAKAADEGGGEGAAAPRLRPRYAEVYLAAESLSGAERLLWDAMEQLTGEERSPDAVDFTVSMDRLRPETLAADLEALGVRKKTDPAPDLDQPRILFSRWLD